jgi:hypothetical protein
LAYCGKVSAVGSRFRPPSRHPKTMPKIFVEPLASSLDAEIARLKRCRGWIRRVEPDLLRTGRRYFATDVEFGRWLATPLAVLKGRAPIEIMYARDGQSLVQGILLQLCAQKASRKQLGAPKKLTLLPAFRKLMQHQSLGDLQAALDEIRER